MVTAKTLLILFSQLIFKSSGLIDSLGFNILYTYSKDHIFFAILIFICLHIFSAGSNDTVYNKTYYVAKKQSFRTTWVGAYSFCAANDLEMMTFDSQDEHDKFFTFIRTNTAKINAFTGYNFQFFLGSIALTTSKPDDFFWYKSGELVIKKIKFDWFTGEPNGAGLELCAAVMQRIEVNGLIGINDYSCVKLDLGRNYVQDTMVCQQTTSYTNGFNNKYSSLN